MTHLDLDAIATRAAGLYEYATGLDKAWQDEADQLTGTDVPALIAELRTARAVEQRLREQHDRDTAEISRLRDELATARDCFKAWLRRADEANNRLMEEVQRYADGQERPVLWSVYNAMHLRAATAEARIWELERPAVEKQRGEIQLSYRQLAAQAREDGDYESEAVVLQRLADREEQWKREDAAVSDAPSGPASMAVSAPQPTHGPHGAPDADEATHGHTDGTDEGAAR
ncbi:hypothetical protein [Streptomyces sp. bgisy154]|uniref:hypothetical protein n=1 Tax=Streptomyces sp. bgisy154 TaxID=3413794 RepID=UPI003D73BBE5